MAMIWLMLSVLSGLHSHACYAILDTNPLCDVMFDVIESIVPYDVTVKYFLGDV